MGFVASVVRLARRGQFEYLRQRIRAQLGVESKAPTAKDKLEVYDYLRTLLLGRDKSAPEKNLRAAVDSFRAGSTECNHMPVLVEYSNTFTGCNIYPPCAKCFSVPKPKIEYAFAGNDFEGLESALTKADVISLGSIAELTFDKNYPAVTEATSADGAPRLSHPTNGILIARHAERIVGKVRALQVSLDAHTPELYAKLQGKAGHLPEIEMGLKKLAALKKAKKTPHPRVLLSVTVSRENVSTLQDFYRHYSNPDFGVDVVLLSRLGRVTEENPGKYRKGFTFDFDEQLIPEAEYSAQVRDLKELSEGRHPPVWELTDYLLYYPMVGHAGLEKLDGPVCPLPWLSTQVSTSGGVYLCCYTPTQVGNWRQQGIEAAWNGEKMRQIRSEIAEHGISRHCLEGTCPVVDRLDSVAREKGHASLLDDLKQDWEKSAHLIRGFMRDILKGTVRESARFFTPSAPREQLASEDRQGAETAR